MGAARRKERRPTVARHWAATSSRPGAERPGKMVRHYDHEDAISSDGKPEDDALGDAEPVQHHQRVSHVIIPPQPECESCSCIEDRL